MLDVKELKKDFPIFHNIPDLVYLDSAATSLKPRSVVDKTIEYYTQYSSNIHRGVYKIAEKATYEYEETREIVANFINASSKNEIIFTKGTTESINLVAYTWGEQNIQKGDEIAVSQIEHHANFVPWQQLALKKHASFKVIDLDINNFELRTNDLKKTITKKTKLLALTYVSNVTGMILPLKELIREARILNPEIIIIIDGAQAVPHMEINLKEIDCDFFAFSSHKMLGPTGVGILWGRENLLSGMKPFNYGGDMIRSVTTLHTEFNDSPSRFEAGTPDIAGVIGLKVAIKYLQHIGMQEIQDHEATITAYVLKCMQQEFGMDITFLGSTNVLHRTAIISFMMTDLHPHDIAQILDEENIAIRAGHHCAMPLHIFLNFDATARASFYIYNDKSDVDKLVEGLKKVRKTLSRFKR
ncbi:MAG TPA: SufS family cysteine desulfurase [Candidatus Nitrosocosmicus sp.]|nr:SufS family cysteine desulfurase [Candidatus Nitrosocosmicus sp.]